MTQQEYEQQKRECWEEYTTISPQYKAFSFAFDRAYALGKQFGISEQVDIEKAAERYADEIRIPASIPGVMVPFFNGLAHDAYLQGARDCLGKQEKDTETKPNGIIKARRKSDGEIIEVEAAVYNMRDGEPYHKCLSDGHHYPVTDLDFNSDAEDAVIQGWVARDADVQWVYLYSSMPTRGINMWNGHGSLLMPLDPNRFPDLTWESEPQECEIIIKRKKK